MAAQPLPATRKELAQRPPNWQRSLQGPQEALRSFLLGVIERVSQGWHPAHHLGFLPHTSIKNKFIYSKEALAHPEVAARPSPQYARAAALHAACVANPPPKAHVKARPKRARDAFGPGMVFVVNTVLAWLMFSIDVRNAMLQ